MEQATRSLDLGVPPLPMPRTGMVNLHSLEADLFDVYTQAARLHEWGHRNIAWLKPEQPTSATPASIIEAKVERKVDTVPESIRANWTRMALTKLSTELHDKIRRMARREDGWRGDGSLALSADALRGFLQFWMKVREQASEPALALTSAGGIEAHWHKSTRKHLDLQFRDSRRIFFGLFSGESVHEGVDRPENIISLLTEHDVQPLQWKS